MADATKKTSDEDATPGDAEESPKRKRRGLSARSAKAGAATIRTQIGRLVWLVAVVCALFLAVGALLVALGDSINKSNQFVQFVLDAADAIDLDIFDRRGDGIFNFDGKNAGVKNALVNWGLGAVAYLVAGRIVSRIIRP